MRNSFCLFLLTIGKNYYFFLCIIFFYILLKGFIVLLPSYMIKFIIDAIVGLGENGFSYKLFFYIFIYFFIQNGIIYMQYLYKYFILYRFTSSVRKDIINIAVEDLLQKRSVFFCGKNSGELVHFVFHLHEYCIDFLIISFEYILPKMVTLLLSVIFFMIFDWICGIILMMWVLVLGLCVRYAWNNFSMISSEVLQGKVGVTKNMIDIIHNILSIKFFCTEQFELNGIKNQTICLARDELQHKKYYVLLEVIYVYSFVIMQIISLIVLYFKYYFGYISIPAIISWWSILGVVGSLGENIITEILTAVKLFSGMYEAGMRLEWSENFSIGHKNFFSYKEGEIIFENVSLQVDDTSIINKFHFTFPARKRIAIIGFSGSGKTSLINLILGIYQATEGSVLIDGQKTVGMDLASFYRRCAVIFQNTTLFDRSILENIFYGLDRKNEKRQFEKYASVIDLLELRNLIDEESIIDFRKSYLSGGEKQRILIARALCQEDKDFFIFDEPTSNLDNISEAKVMEYIKKITIDKTLIMITHKLSIIHDFDVILVMDKGELVESGNHNELMEKNGLYKKLYLLDTLV